MYYKVLRPDLTSVFTGCTQYAIDEWTYPKVGKLFVFKEFRHAWKIGYTKKIYQCEVLNAEKQNEIVDTFGISDDKIKRFWIGTLPDYYKWLAPEGTYCVEGVKLIRCVNDYLPSDWDVPEIYKDITITTSDRTWALDNKEHWWDYLSPQEKSHWPNACRQTKQFYATKANMKALRIDG